MKKEILFLFVIAIFLMPNVNALNSDYCVAAEVSDISPSSIGIGDEFTVGIHVENCGNEAPEYISFELIAPPVDISVKEPLIINISNLYYSNSERFITYHMRTADDAQPGAHLIKTRLVYGKEGFLVTNDYNITFEVIGDRAELAIASLKTSPVLPKKGDTVELTIRIENTGDGTAKSVGIYADHPFKGIKQSFIGALDSDEDGPAVLTFIANKKGEFEFPVNITYYDDFGKNEIETELTLNVLRKETDVGAIIIILLILVLSGAGIYYFSKTKREKDRIIHQLLQGENFNREELKETPKKPLKKTREEERDRKRRMEEFKKEVLAKYRK